LTKLQLGDSHGTGRQPRGQKQSDRPDYRQRRHQDLSSVESAFEKIANRASHPQAHHPADRGVSTPGTQEDFPRLEREALAKQVTISTIGVGDYINRELLEELGAQDEGAKCISSRIRKRSRKIINAEVRSKDDLAIQERPVRAVRDPAGGIYRRHRLRPLAASAGFVKAEAKEGSETILRVDIDKPLLVRCATAWAE